MQLTTADHFRGFCTSVINNGPGIPSRSLPRALIEKAAILSILTVVPAKLFAHTALHTAVNWPRHLGQVRYAHDIPL